MKAIDLFCGIGGFHYAAKRNGVDVVFASEIDKFAVAQYELNHGLKPQGDITQINTSDIPDHDLLMGGFPCQAFSIAGKRKGFEDTRGTLFFEIARILNDKRPSCFLLENVPALLSHDKKRTFQVMERTLQELGYYLHAKLLNAKDFGLPQNRNRIFIVGFRELKHHNAFKFPQGIPLTKCIKDILENDIDDKYYLSEKLCKYVTKRESNGGGFLKIDPDISPCLMANYGKIGSGSFISNKIERVGALSEKDSQWSRFYDPNGINICLSSCGGGVGSNTGLILVDGKNGEKISQRVYSQDGLYPSMTGVLQKIQEDTRIRRLTPRECARLQGFPEDYKIACSDSQAYKQFGNSVAIPVVEAIIKNIVKVLTPT